MPRSKSRGGVSAGAAQAWAGALFLLGWVLFGYPLITLFAADDQLLGLPGPLVYLFGSWILFIGLLALLAWRVRP